MVATVSSLPSPNARPTTSPQLEELGVTLDLPFGTWNEEIFNPAEATVPDLLIRLDQMQRTDGHMRALYRLLALPFRRAGFDVKPAEQTQEQTKSRGAATLKAKGSADGSEEADFVEKALTRPPYEGGMSTSFDYVRAIMCRAFVYGFQVMEKVWQIADVPGFGQAVTLKKLAPRQNHTIRFRADPNGGFNGVIQRAYDPAKGYTVIEIPKEKVFFFTVDKEEHPFYGRSLFEPGLYHFDKKHKLYYIAHVAAQMSAVPARLAYLDQADLTPNQKINLRSGLASLGFNSAMLVPPGVRIEPFGNSTQINGEILNLINHHNIQASQEILAQFLDLSMGGNSSGGGTGSYALSKDSSDMFLMCLETLLFSGAEHFNFYVTPQLVDFNFGSGRYPQICFDPLADDMRQAMVTVYQTISSAQNYRGTPEFLLELEKQVSEGLGLTIDYDEIEAQQEAAEEQAAKVAQAVNTLAGQGAPKPPTPGGTEKIPSAAKGDGGTGDTPANVSETAKALITLAERQQTRQRLTSFARLGEMSSGAGMAADPQRSMTSPIAADIQKRLKQLGHLTTDEEGFGPATVAAVKAFQAAQGLAVTGKVDLGTYAMLLDQAKGGR